MFLLTEDQSIWAFDGQLEINRANQELHLCYKKILKERLKFRQLQCRERYMSNCLCSWFCKSQEPIMRKDKTIRISCMIKACRARDFWLPTWCFLWQGRRFLYADLKPQYRTSYRKQQLKGCLILPVQGQLKQSLQALWVRGSLPRLLEAARASSVPDSCSSPYLVLTLQQQEHSSFSECSHAFPNDPGHCPHKIQKLPKQNSETAAQAAASAAASVSCAHEPQGGSCILFRIL